MAEQDDRIVAEVRERLKVNPDVEPREISVTVENGMVTLGGPVATRRARELAEEAAAEVEGVLAVDNQLHISGPGEATEGGLQGDTSRPDGRPPLDPSGRP